MDDIREQIEELDVAIKRWIVFANGDGGSIVQTSYCNLCDIYKDSDNDGDCEDCPIVEYTGETCCYDTPFYETYKYATWGDSSEKDELIQNNLMLSLLYEIRLSLVRRLYGN